MALIDGHEVVPTLLSFRFGEVKGHPSEQRHLAGLPQVPEHPRGSARLSRLLRYCGYLSLSEIPLGIRPKSDEIAQDYQSTLGTYLL